VSRRRHKGWCLCFPAVPWFPESALNEFQGQAHTTTPNGVALANEKSQFLDFHSSLELATALPFAQRALGRSRKLEAWEA